MDAQSRTRRYIDPVVTPALPSHSQPKNTFGPGYVIDLLSVSLTMLAVFGGIFIPSHYKAPWPLMLAMPALRHLSIPEKFHQAFRVMFRPWLWVVILFFAISIFMARTTTQGVFILSSAVYVVALVLFIDNRQERFVTISWTFAILLGLSCLLFVLRVYGNPIADSIYFTIYERDEFSYLVEGLASRLHKFGYQIAALIPLSFALLMGSERLKNKFIACLVFGLSIWSLILSGQRSAAVGGIIGVALLGLFVPFRTKLLLVLLLIMTVQFGEYLVPGGTESLYIKIQETQDYSWRAALQWRALDTIVHTPLGLYLSGKSWNVIASDLIGGGDPLTSHNAYLVHILNLGWIAGIGIIALLAVTITRNWRVVMAQKMASGRTLFFVHIGLFASMMAVLVNALFHNSSIFTLDGPTWVVYSTLWLWHDYSNRYYRKPSSPR